MKLRSFHALAWLLLLPLAAACSSPQADRAAMNYDNQFNFSGVRTLYIEPQSRTNPATITISDAQIERINGAIGAELERKGFEVVKASRQADLFLSWYLVTEDPVSTDDDCSGCDMAAGGATRYSRGTLIVDMVDPMRNQPVWRSVLHTGLTADPGSDKAEEARQAAAAAVFASFPPQ
jgi:hypothetical protein